MEMQSCMAPAGNNAFSEIRRNDATVCEREPLQPCSKNPSAPSLSLPHRPVRATSSSSFYFSFVSLFQSFLLFSRLSSEDLSSTVLEYMTETLGYSLSEIIHVVTTNRPSALTASYHLLLSRLNRSQRGAKASKVFPL